MNKRKAELLKAIQAIIEVIETPNEKINNRRLIDLCRHIPVLNGQNDPHIYHETAEAALNSLIKNKYATELLNSENPIDPYEQLLKPLVNRIPTQTWRSSEQTKWQQFSTPPTIAFFLAYLMNFQNGENVLEPSAGTGSLAIWASSI